MNHVLCRQIVSPGNLRLSGFAAPESSAFLKEPRACRPVNGAVNSASPQKGFVGGVHNCVHLQTCNVPRIYFNILFFFFNYFVKHVHPRRNYIVVEVVFFRMNLGIFYPVSNEYHGSGTPSLKPSEVLGGAYVFLHLTDLQPRLQCCHCSLFNAFRRIGCLRENIHSFESHLKALFFSRLPRKGSNIRLDALYYGFLHCSQCNVRLSPSGHHPEIGSAAVYSHNGGHGISSVPGFFQHPGMFDGFCQRKGRIGSVLGPAGMGGPALHENPKPPGSAHYGSRLQHDSAFLKSAPVVEGIHPVYILFFYELGAFCPADSRFLSVLEYEIHVIPGSLTAHPAAKAVENGAMSVVSASVGNSRSNRGIFDTLNILHGKSVHVCPDSYVAGIGVITLVECIKPAAPVTYLQLRILCYELHEIFFCFHFPARNLRYSVELVPYFYSLLK